MKKISIIMSLFTLLVLLSCSSTGGNNKETGMADGKEGTVVHLTNDMFKKLVWDYQKNPDSWVFQGDLPCIIDFYADWCRPCKMVAPIMDELAKEYQGKIRIYKINTDQERELASMFNIRSIPAIMYIPKTGKPTMSLGAMAKPAYVQQINDVLLKNDTVKK